MFEAAELGRRVSKEEFNEQVPRLWTKLLEAQRALRRSDRALVILISGVEGAGKSEVLSRLNAWLDPRNVRTFAFWNETDEEREHPRPWRFWRALPPKGRIHILFGSWYTQPIIERVYGDISGKRFQAHLKSISAFERMLADDGTHFVKLWFHLPKKVQAKRVAQKTARKAQDIDRAQELAKKGKKKKKASKDKKGGKDKKKHDKDKKSAKDKPALSSLASDFSRRYDDFRTASAQAVTATDTGFAPWHVIEATDRRYRDLAVGQILLDSITAALDQSKREADPAVVMPRRVSDETVLETVDLSQSLDPESYDDRLERAQRRIRELAWAAYNAKRSLVAVFQGWDASGKGGAIRRFTAALDARLYKVISIAAPTDEEKAHHYLWRFWRHIPRDGYVTVFDRSWYGRVLVERVEGFCSQAEWARAYAEINDFEARLTDHGIGLAKFWIHISKDEQLRRFQAREVTPWKQHKITDEDWRNRDKWDLYAGAVDDMVAHTSTARAPWHLISGNDKKLARVQIIETLAKTFEDMFARG